MKEEEVRKYKRGKQKGMRRREGNAEARMGWDGREGVKLGEKMI